MSSNTNDTVADYQVLRLVRFWGGRVREALFSSQEGAIASPMYGLKGPKMLEGFGLGLDVSAYDV